MAKQFSENLKNIYCSSYKLSQIGKCQKFFVFSDHTSLRSRIIELLAEYSDKVIFKVLFDSRALGESSSSRHTSSQK